MSSSPERFDPEAVVRRYYDLVDDESYDALFELFTDDVVYERPGQTPIKGKEAFESFYLEDRPLRNGTHEIRSIVVETTDRNDGPTVGVRGAFSGVQDGDRVRFGFADFHEFDGDRIGRRYTFTDRDEV